MSFFVREILEQLRDSGDVEGYYKIKQVCSDLYDQILQQIFELVYFGKFSAEYVETMTPEDRNKVFKMLNDARDKESEATANMFKG